MTPDQEELFAGEERREAAMDGEGCDAERHAVPRMSEVNRAQVILQKLDLEELIPQEHRARLIWEVVGKLDLSGYEKKIKAVEGRAGRTAISPRLLVSLWIYAYSIGEGSAREIARLCEYEPALVWLTGRQSISAKTLSDFRSGDEEGLKGLFSQVLGVLKKNKLIELQRIAQDGTKIRAYASRRSFQRGRTIQQQMQQAREHMERVDREAESVSAKRAQARKRAARERLELLEQASATLAELSGKKKDSEEARVSVTDPEARTMKQADGGFAPSYNAQLVTDEKSGLVIAAHLTQCGSDAESLQQGVQQVEKEFGEKPQQMLTDGGYVSKSNMVEMEAQQIEWYAPPADNEARTRGLNRALGEAYRAEAFCYDAGTDCYRCPQGAVLAKVSVTKRRGEKQHIYCAPLAGCLACPCKPQCSPTANQSGRRIVRRELAAEVEQFYQRMRTDAAAQVRKRRSQIAEFPNAWLKTKIGLRQFRLRGIIKAEMELLWGCLAYNLSRAIRICPELAST
jgi:transposase